MTSLPNSRLAHMMPELGDMASRLLAQHAQSQRARTVVALAGPPAAGKSTLSERLCEALNTLEADIAVVVPMDGYHFDNAVLAPRGLLDIKGAPETFDAEGLRRDLIRVRENSGSVAVPVFDRPLDLARAGGRVVEPHHRIVLVEGNYLLLEHPPWSTHSALYDLSIFLDIEDEVLIPRLLNRWREMGQDARGAYALTYHKDMLNAHLIKTSSRAADWRWRLADAPIVQEDTLPPSI
ncbi:nucleoside triphosphate hydrolase [Cobetia sp. L2A1]|uniref:nucleoside triphosphate hydrolase n=1 Tax=Cobetia sp. L2A1 TaxID=2686360 RepID=UPI002D7F082E|nr:nucleoside triphosphate hydrolase [Cobetia sp. L2A1]